MNCVQTMVRNTVPLLLAASLLGGCAPEGDKAPGAGEEDTRPLGRVGTVVVEEEEFSGYVKEQIHVDVKEMPFEDRRQFLRWVLVRKSLAAEAVKAGFGEDPMIERSLLELKLKSYPRYYLKTQVEDAVEISDEELRDFVDPEELYQVSVIILGYEDEGRGEAEEVAGLLDAGGDFAALAKERSRGLLAAQGGDMGWQPLPNYSIDDEASRLIRLMKPGEHTAPMETQIGWSIYRLGGYMSADENFQEKKEKRRPELFSRKYAEAKAARIAELKEKASVVIHLGEEGFVPGGPLAVVDGQAIMPQNIAGGHQGQEVYPPEVRLQRFIESYIFVREVERLGLDAEGDLAHRLSYHRMKMLAEKAVDAAIRDQVEITPEDLRAEYARVALREVYDLQVVRTETREEAEEALREIDAGADLGEVSRRYSWQQLAEKDGKLQSMTLADFTDEGRAAVSSLADGEHTGVLRNAEAIYLVVKRLSMREVEPPSLEEVERSLRRTLTIRRRAELAQAYLQEFSAGLSLEINEEKLGAL